MLNRYLNVNEQCLEHKLLKWLLEQWGATKKVLISSGVDPMVNQTFFRCDFSFDNPTQFHVPAQLQRLKDILSCKIYRNEFRYILIINAEVIRDLIKHQLLNLKIFLTILQPNLYIHKQKELEDNGIKITDKAIQFDECPPLFPICDFDFELFFKNKFSPPDAKEYKTTTSTAMVLTKSFFLKEPEWKGSFVEANEKENRLLDEIIYTIEAFKKKNPRKNIPQETHAMEVDDYDRAQYDCDIEFFESIVRHKALHPHRPLLHCFKIVIEMTFPHDCDIHLSLIHDDLKPLLQKVKVNSQSIKYGKE